MRRGVQTTNRWPLYLPTEFIPRFNEIMDHLETMDLSMSALMRELIDIWMASEERLNEGS